MHGGGVGLGVGGRLPAATDGVVEGPAAAESFATFLLCVGIADQADEEQCDDCWCQHGIQRVLRDAACVRHLGHDSAVHVGDDREDCSDDEQEGDAEASAIPRHKRQG